MPAEDRREKEGKKRLMETNFRKGERKKKTKKEGGPVLIKQMINQPINRTIKGLKNQRLVGYALNMSK